MFPIRIDWELSDELDQFISDTKTTKTEFTKSAITKMLSEFNRSGVRKSIKEIYKV
jgi:predicted DNA-binding protein